MSGKGKAHSLHGHLESSMLIGSGVVNGIINAIIFYLLNRSKTELHQSLGIYIDLAATIFIITAIVVPIAFSQVKGAAKKGSPFVAAFAKGDHLFLKRVPQNGFVATILFALINTLFIPAFFVGLAAVFAPAGLGLIGATVLKFFATSVCGAMSAYFGTMHAVLNPRPVVSAVPQAA